MAPIGHIFVGAAGVSVVGVVGTVWVVWVVGAVVVVLLLGTGDGVAFGKESVPEQPARDSRDRAANSLRIKAPPGPDTPPDAHGFPSSAPVGGPCQAGEPAGRVYARFADPDGNSWTLQSW
jgi:hypothetical protein